MRENLGKRRKIKMKKNHFIDSFPRRSQCLESEIIYSNAFPIVDK